MDLNLVGGINGHGFGGFPAQNSSLKRAGLPANRKDFEDKERYDLSSHRPPGSPIVGTDTAGNLTGRKNHEPICRIRQSPGPESVVQLIPAIDFVPQAFVRRHRHDSFCVPTFQTISEIPSHIKRAAMHRGPSPGPAHGPNGLQMSPRVYGKRNTQLCKNAT